MGYNHTQYSVSLGNDVNVATTGEKGDWSPGFVPHIVRAFSVGVTVASATTTATVVTFYKNTLGTTTTDNRTTIDTVTIPAATAAGAVYYVDNFASEISPGQELQATCTTAATTTGVVMIDAFVEPRWEQPGNDTNMTQSA